MGIFRGTSLGTAFGQQSWAGGQTHSWAEVLHAATISTSADERFHKESAYDTSMETPCRTAYTDRTLANVLFINCFSFIFKHTYIFN